MKTFAETHRITHTTVPSYHPQANPVERVNKILKTMIVSFIKKDHREWDKLKICRFSDIKIIIIEANKKKLVIFEK